MKIYEYHLGSHRFDSDGKYLGWFDPEGNASTFGAPFDTWMDWDEGKHTFLTEELKFNFREEQP